MHTLMLQPQEFSYIESNTSNTKPIPENQLEHVTTKDDALPYHQNRPAPIFNLENNPIVCNCDAFHLINYVQQQKFREFNLKFEGIRCHRPKELENTSLDKIPLGLLDIKCPLSSMFPDLNESCPGGCNCEYRPADRCVIVNCHGAGMQTFPSEVLNISGFALELNFSGNNFNSLDGLSNLSSVRNVTKLILSSNKLTNIDDIVKWNGLQVSSATYNVSFWS